LGCCSRMPAPLWGQQCRLVHTSQRSMRGAMETGLTAPVACRGSARALPIDARCELGVQCPAATYVHRPLMLKRRSLLAAIPISLAACAQTPLRQSRPTATSAAVISLLVPETPVDLIHIEAFSTERDPKTLRSPVALNDAVARGVVRLLASKRPDLRLVAPAFDGDTFALTFQGKSTFFQTPITPMRAAFGKMAEDFGVDLVVALSDARYDATYANGKSLFLRRTKDVSRNDVSCTVYVVLHVFARSGDLLQSSWFGQVGRVPARSVGLSNDLAPFTEPSVQEAMNVLLQNVAIQAASGALSKLPL
jgi:hypothetical protein